MHVVVIGAGFVGGALAEALVRRNATVTLVGREPSSTDASTASFGWLNSHRKRPDAYQALNRAALDLWREDFGARYAEHVVWGGHTVIVAVPDNVAALRQRVEHLHGLGYPASFVPLGDALVSLPIVPAHGAVAAEFPIEGHCNPAAILDEVLQSLEASGSCDIVTEEAIAIGPHGVTLRSGSRIEADRIVIAAGNGSPALAASAGYHLPLVPQDDHGPAWGFLASASVPSHGIDRVVSTDYLNIRPDGPDALIAQCLDLDRHAGPGAQPTPTLSDRFASRIGRLLGRDDVVVESVRLGHRVIPLDGQTAAGPMDGNPNAHIWAIVTHSGITLAPLLADTVAREMTECALESVLDEFRPTRFDNDSRASVQVPAPRHPGEQ